ncbi:glycosyltransferase family 4 protein [Aridibaculum aurantiacum]|uniref:glycosyltransferase family 4 protein n=1 Tax=Aridibaculum aurantiacum TaxID=2810307 RepID=UPI001A96F6A4|nr:glycosyltransferase family 4 protein [Aridibaculum aurantiacum]
MKILHVTQNYYPSAGGPQYTMQHVSEKLVEYYNDEVKVATTNSLFNPESPLYQRVDPASEVINGVEVTRYPYNRWHFPLIKYGGKVYGKLFNKSLPYSISKLRWSLDSPAIDRAMRLTDADVIMATTINYNFCNYPMWRHKTADPKPFVLYGAIHLHKALPHDHPSLAKAKACDCYIANTDFEKHELINYGVAEEKIVTIGTGIDLDSFHCNADDVNHFRKLHGINEDDCVVGFVGRLVKGKGVAILIDALRKMHKTNSNMKLLLAGGTTDYVPVIQRAIDEEGLPIILIRDFPEEQKKIIFYSIDVFVLASQSESFGVVFLEAWACRKPVIGTRMGATESLLDEGIGSLLFTGGDVDELCHQLQLLMNNKELQARLGNNGFEKVQQKFTWPSIVAAYRNAYEIGIENFHRTYKTAAAL